MQSNEGLRHYYQNYNHVHVYNKYITKSLLNIFMTRLCFFLISQNTGLVNHVNHFPFEFIGITQIEKQ